PATAATRRWSESSGKGKKVVRPTRSASPSCACCWIGAPIRTKRSLHEEALRRGFTEMAELLLHYGASPGVVALDGEEAFAAACLRLERDEARTLLGQHPEYLLTPGVMTVAAELDRADVA